MAAIATKPPAQIAAKPPAQSAVAENGGNRCKAARAKRGGENGGRKAARAKRWWRNMAAIAAKTPAQSAGGARGSRGGVGDLNLGYGVEGGGGRPGSLDPPWARPNRKQLATYLSEGRNRGSWL